MRMSLTLVVLGLSCVSAFGAGGDSVRVTAQVDTSRDIYAGEDFQYHIIIDGARQAGQVDTAPLNPWNPRSAGMQDLSRTVTQIINGRSSTQVIERIAMTYLLTAPVAGRITLPSVSVVIQGRIYRTEPVTLNIAEPGTTDLLDVEIAVTPSQCYVGQPVELAVRFFVGQDIRNSQFNIPVLANDAFRLEMPDTIPAGASQSELAPGVTMIVTQQTTVHKGRRAELFTLRNILLPQRPGTFAIEPVTVSTDMAVGRTRSRDPFFDDFSFFGSQTQYKRFQVRSQPSSLTVRPLPAENRPAGFYGLVGDYEIMAEASVTKVNIGDPITLCIKVAGGFLKPVQWPDLSAIPDLARNFKIPEQQASPVVENGFKVFTQTLRANNDSVTEIPSIELPYFSPTKGQYAIARTKPIPLEVAQTRILTGADIEGRQSVTLSKEVEVIRQGISANYEDPDCLVDRTFSPLAALVSPAYGLLWAGPLIALLASAGARALGRNDPRKQAAARRRKARVVVARRLKTVLAASGSERPAQMVEAMRQYIGDRFDRVPGSLTADDCCRIIHQAGGDADAAGRYRDIMAQYEASRYAPAQAAVDDAGVAEVLELIRRIDAKTRKITLRSAIIVFCLLGVGVVSAAAMTRQEMTELFVQANDAFRRANAQTDAEQSKRLYEQAILGYERIINVGGVRNPMLYYNVANAYLLKGDVGRAILNYRRAEVLDRSNRDIRKNLAFARGRRLDTVQVRIEQRVLQTLFFWHYDLSLKTRFCLGCVFFAVACLSLTLRIAPRISSHVHRPTSIVFALAAVLTLCMAASVVTGVVAGAHRVEGVIVADEVVARQADWPDAAPSFKGPLHAGLEFELVEQRRDYFHIRLPDGSDGWIPTTAAELI